MSSPPSGPSYSDPDLSPFTAFERYIGIEPMDRDDMAMERDGDNMEVPTEAAGPNIS